MSWRLAPYHQCTNPCLQQSSICSCPPEQLKHLLHFRAYVQAHLRPKHLSDAVNLYMCASRLYSSCYAHLHLSVAADWCPHQVSKAVRVYLRQLCTFALNTHGCSCVCLHSAQTLAAVRVCRDAPVSGGVSLLRTPVSSCAPAHTSTLGDKQCHRLLFSLQLWTCTSAACT